MGDTSDGISNAQSPPVPAPFRWYLSDQMSAGKRNAKHRRQRTTAAAKANGSLISALHARKEYAKQSCEKILHG